MIHKNPVTYVKSHSIFDAVTFMLLGAFMLILTPIFRVISTFIIFVKTKDDRSVKLVMIS